MYLEEEAGQDGAYYCPYPSFIDSYHMAVRIMERSRQSIYLMLCTIHDERKQLTENLERLKEISDKLAESIQIALRRGDVFTRYNMSQFLVILMGIRQEERPITVSWIDACFHQRESSRRV
ncbi:MAG: GGDEF domain-containing protein [Lachnospiraceae bacterium]|nr:GGDEF domain-containing protein [Lachnospiraceae bacterium]